MKTTSRRRKFTETTTKEWLEIMLKVRQDNPSMLLPSPGYHYSCIEDFLLREGQEFKHIDFDHKYPYGEIKNCYQNAADLAIRHPELTYVEGYATVVIPTLHAWLVDKEDRVIDVTWQDFGEYEPHGYWGVKFPQRVLMSQMVETKMYGLLDAWESRWPMLRKPFADRKREYERLP